MQIDDHAVRERAYHIWEGEGRVHGRADDHWIRAEAELALPLPVISAVQAARPAAEPAVKVAAGKAERAVAKAAPTKAVPAKGASAKAASKPSSSKTPAKASRAAKAAVAAGLSAQAAVVGTPAAIH